MNYVDTTYLKALSTIVEYGTYKKTRSGEVRSYFSINMRFDLTKGFPLLTSKRMFYKGIIHELLWFLQGNTNIKYLVDNNVHIWDDDAYRWYKDMHSFNGWLDKLLDKETFVQYVKEGRKLNENYTYGDLGPVYGKQWRNWDGVDQIANIIDTLKFNPDDRRLILNAWNVGELSNMALPPCHVYYQFYSRPLTRMERLDWLCDHSNGEYDEYHTTSDSFLDEKNVPKRALSCMIVCRSQDFPLGTPYNIASCAFLTHMIAEVTNHTVDSLVYMGGDCHVYENQMDGVKQQLRRPSHTLPRLRFARKVTDIDDFKFSDFLIENYCPEPTIHFPLSVG